MNPDFGAPAANVFGTAIQWLDGTLLGAVATVVAVLSVASVGFLLMTGRIDLRRGAQVIFGCFILFGASSIAGGIMRMMEDRSSPGVPSPASPGPPRVNMPSAATTPAFKPVPYDPYAGAAMPTRP